MNEPTLLEALRVKQKLRKEAAARRARQTDTERLSRQLFERLVALPEYVRAATVMLYLDLRDEVQTQWFVPMAWEEGKRVAVPYCQHGEIDLFRLDDFSQVAPGMMGVLEPRKELRGDSEQKIDPAELDLIITPGLAFDHRGGRLGYGKGYYDRLFRRVRDDATKMAVCFECQMFADVPQLPHDIPMDLIVTETAVYRADGGRTALPAN